MTPILRAQLGLVVVAQVLAVEQDATFGRVVESREQLDEGRLAGSVLADEREALAAGDEDVDLSQRPFFLARVTEPYALEANSELGARCGARRSVLASSRRRARGGTFRCRRFFRQGPSKKAKRFDM